MKTKVVLSTWITDSTGGTRYKPEKIHNFFKVLRKKKDNKKVIIKLKFVTGRQYDQYFN